MPEVKIEADITRVFQDVIRQLRPAQGSSRIPLGRDVNQLLEDAKASAFWWISKSSDAVIRPTIRFYGCTGKIAEIIVPAGFEEDVRIAASAAIVLRMAAMEGYFVTSEAWMAFTSQDDAVDALLPAQRSDRQEVLVIAAGLPANHVVRLFPIERGPDGKCARFGNALQASHIQFSNPLLLDLFDIDIDFDDFRSSVH